MSSLLLLTILSQLCKFAFGDEIHADIDAGGCFVKWGSNECPTNYTAVVKGRSGGLESWGADTFHANVECVDVNAPVSASYSLYTYSRMMYSSSDGSGMTRCLLLFSVIHLQRPR